MKHGDRVQETTTTNGTGSLTLAGATVGHLSFDDEIGEATECVYLIELASDPSVWEISKGTLTGTTLTRTLIKSSTGSLLDLSGTYHVSQVLDAAWLSENVQSADVREIVTLTETQYAALDPVVSTTLYIVTPDA